MEYLTTKTINFVDWRHKAYVRKLKIFLIMIVVSLFLSISVTGYNYFKLQQQIVFNEENNNILKNLYDKLLDGNFSFLPLDKKSPQSIKILQDLQLSLSFRQYKLAELSILPSLLPPNVTLLRLVYNKNTIHITGNATKENDIFIFADNLSNSSLFSEAKIIESRKKTVGESSIISFDIKISLIHI